MTNWKKIVGDVNWDKLCEQAWDDIVSCMDKDIREQVHLELAPCTKAEFITRYFELDKEFEDTAYYVVYVVEERKCRG